MSEIYEVLSPGGHEAMVTSIFTYIKNYMDAHGPGSKVDRAGDTMTGALTITTNNTGLTLKPASGEGGELHLEASTANTTQAGIILDQYDSKLRIFGIPSADGTTKTGVGSVLSIDPYSKNISGEYTLTFNKVVNAISYTGTKATYPMIKFKDNTSDTYGNGIYIGGGGATIIGGGESSDAMAEAVNGGDEILYLGNDGNVDIFSNLQSGWANRKHVCFNTSGTLVFDDTGAANIQVPARGISWIQGNNGNAGIYAKKTLNTDQWYPVVCMDTKSGGSWAMGNYNNEYLEFSYATKANRDASKNETSIVHLRNTAGTIALTSEAIKSISRSGTTFTATRADGTTFTFTQQDNNTTYSAGTGLSLSSTTFNHANYGSAGTAGTSSATSGLSIKIPYLTTNAQGHVTGKGEHTHTVNGVLYWKWISRSSMAQSNRLDYWTIGKFPAKSGYSRAIIAMQISNRDVYPSHYDFSNDDVRIWTKTLEPGTQNFNAELLCVYFKDSDKW